MHVLKLTVKSAANITSSSSSLTSYYVTAIFSGKKLKTKPAVNSYNPVWNEELRFFFEDGRIEGAAVLFLLKRTSFLPLFKKKRVVAWCELHRDHVLKISTEVQEFRLKWIDNVTGNNCGVLIVACQIMEVLDIERQASGNIKNKAVESAEAIGGHFVIDVFHAEFLPRSDLSYVAYCRGACNDENDAANHLIDPYLVFRFADEEVGTKVIRRNSNPLWMQRLFLPFKMPFRDLSLRLELKDKDLIGYDDLVAATDLSISEMTAGGATGFLPSFGPSYINFYGTSQRTKVSTVQMEGCEFRGRVFLQVTTTFGDSMQRNTGFYDIPPEIVHKSQVFQKKEDFIIRITFLDFYLTQDADPKSIEVSIGPFGDSDIVGSDYIKASSLPPFLPIPLSIENGRSSNSYLASWSTTDKPCITYIVPLEGSAIVNIVTANLTSKLQFRMTELSRYLTVANFRSRKSVLKFLSDLKNLNAVCQRVLDDGFYDDILTDVNAEQHRILNKCLRIIIRGSSKMIDGVHDKNLDSEFFDHNGDMLRNWIQIVHGLFKDIRQTFPDLFIWLRDVKTNQKISYFRVPAYEIWYDVIEYRMGRLCDRTSSFQFKYPLGRSTRENPGQVSVRMWLGREDHRKSCLETNGDTEMYTFFAEKYELSDRSCSSCLWKEHTTWWMDAFGMQRFDKISLNMEGWLSEGSWYPDSDSTYAVRRSTSSAVLATVSKSGFQPVSSSDSQKGSEVESFEMKSFTKVPATPSDVSETTQKSASASVKWRLKMSYRRDSFPTFRLLKTQKTRRALHYSFPTLYLQFKEQHSYTLAVYVYQGKNLLAGDKTGLSDPFIRIIFGGRGVQTQCLPQTVSPVWNECLLLENVIIGGTNYAFGSFTAASVGHFDDMPSIIVEAYDYDEPASMNFLGSTSFCPSLGLPRWKLLTWRTLLLEEKFAGELLIGTELISIDSKMHSQQKKAASSYDQRLAIPKEIVPVLQRSVVEIFCFRLHDCTKKIHPFVEFLCFDVDPIASTDVLTEFPKVDHFQNNHFIVNLLLPLDSAYLPSLTIRLKSVAYFGNVLSVGGATMELCHLVTFMLHFQSKPLRCLHHSDKSASMDVLYATVAKNWESLRVQENLLEVVEDELIDWWNRYYFSVSFYAKHGNNGNNRSYKPLVIYNSALEETEPYKTCLRLVHNVDIHTGMNLPFQNESTKIAALKVAIGLHCCENGDKSELASEQPHLQTTLFGEMSRMSLEANNVLVRVYIIRARGLLSKDIFGLADPYVRVQVDNHFTEVPGTLRHNTLEPLFGRVYETTLRWPGTPRLSIEIMDRDIVGGDDLIGRTTVDLESRILLSPACHSNCGTSFHFLSSGPYAWRDVETPKMILDTIRKARGFTMPFSLDDYYTKTGMTDVGTEPRSLQEELLALHILHEMNWVVAEHIETRELFHPSFPGVTQGKLEMWIDIFRVDKDNISPAAVDISPRTPKPYELRCIVYNAFDVLLDDRNIFGERMSDVYVEGWLDGLKHEKQSTDVHYRSLDGEAHFNWRMVFQFDFVRGENVLVRNVRHHVTDVYSSEILAAPILHLQLYDYDIISYDEPLATLALPLLDMTSPLAKLQESDRKSASLKPPAMPKSTINLFKTKRLRGFWPCFSPDSHHVVSKLELELELLTEDEAKARPAGRGRGEPNENPRLEKPARSSDSVSWIASPLLAIRRVIWPKLRQKCLTFLAIILIILLVYSVAKIIMDALVHKWVYSWK